MKCSKCGSELTEDTKFCSYCGEKTIQSESVSPIPNSDETHAAESAYNSPSARENITPSNANKVKETWNKLSIFEKISVIGIALFALSALVALLAGKTFAGIIAIIQIALAVIALLAKKQVIKVPKSWISIVALVLSFVLIVPYVSLFNVDMSKNEKYKWSDVVLSDMIPQPKSNCGEIINNSSDYLSIYIYKTSAKQYNEYVTSCKDKGFTVDAEQTDHSFDGYNESGFKLSLYYNENDKEIHIGLDAAMEMSTIKWPDSEFAKLLPVPKSNVGKIEKDDNTGFVAYVGKTPLDDYKAYIADCANNGFTVDVNKTDKSFSAKNENAYKITVNYQGNNTMCISAYEPEYDVSIEVECVENLIFSKYDVEVYLDDSSEGTLKHGGNDIYDVTLKKGVHTVKFVSAEDDSVTGTVKIDISKNDTLKLKISCTDSSIDVETISGNTADTSSDSNTTTSEKTSSSTETTKDNETTQYSDPVSMPVMKGSSLDSIVSVASTYGLSSQFSDEDWGHGTKMRGMSSSGLSLDIVYSSSTKEVLLVSVVTFTNLSTPQEQKEFVKEISKVACPSSDSSNVESWVTNNIDEERETIINNVTYELFTGSTGNLCYNAGNAEWEEWFLAINP